MSSEKERFKWASFGVIIGSITLGICTSIYFNVWLSASLALLVAGISFLLIGLFLAKAFFGPRYLVGLGVSLLPGLYFFPILINVFHSLINVESINLTEIIFAITTEAEKVWNHLLHESLTSFEWVTVAMSFFLVASGVYLAKHKRSISPNLKTQETIWKNRHSKFIKFLWAAQGYSQSAQKLLDIPYYKNIDWENMHNHIYLNSEELIVAKQIPEIGGDLEKVNSYYEKVRKMTMLYDKMTYYRNDYVSDHNKNLPIQALLEYYADECENELERQQEREKTEKFKQILDREEQVWRKLCLFTAFTRNPSSDSLGKSKIFNFLYQIHRIRTKMMCKNLEKAAVACHKTAEILNLKYMSEVVSD